MKLVLVVRTDLGMGRGKMAAQAAHAAVLAALAAPSRADFIRWLEEGQPKVVLKAGTGECLRQVADGARAAGLPVEVVHDAGLTQVPPGTATCCAIGPADSDRVDAITGGLSLL